MDLLLTGDGDAIFINGPLQSSSVTHLYTQTVTQRLRIRLSTFMGEWFWNTTYGVPYWQNILGIKASKAAIDLIFQQQILSEVGVKEIISFSSTYSNRKYSLTFTVRVVDGQITQPISITTEN